MSTPPRRLKCVLDLHELNSWAAEVPPEDIGAWLVAMEVVWTLGRVPTDSEWPDLLAEHNANKKPSRFRENLQGFCPAMRKTFKVILERRRAAEEAAERRASGGHKGGRPKKIQKKAVDETDNDCRKSGQSKTKNLQGFGDPSSPPPHLPPHTPPSYSPTPPPEEPPSVAALPQGGHDSPILFDDPVLEHRVLNGQTRTRKPDEIWDALVEHFDLTVTDRNRSRIGMLVSELKNLGATPDEIRRRQKTFEREWDRKRCTPHALVKHWDHLGRIAVESELKAGLDEDISIPEL